MSIVPLSSTSAVGSPAPPLISTAAQADIPISALRRFTVEEYHAMIASGFFAEDERYELLRGLLVQEMGKNRAHSIAHASPATAPGADRSRLLRGFTRSGGYERQRARAGRIGHPREARRL